MKKEEKILDRYVHILYNILLSESGTYNYTYRFIIFIFIYIFFIYIFIYKFIY